MKTEGIKIGEASCLTTVNCSRFTVHSLCMLIVLAFLLLPSLINAAVMEDYCQVPPYVMTRVMPNIMIAYEKGADIVKGAYYGAAYDSTKTYYGFFKSTANYTYNESSEYFEQPSPACAPTGINNCFSGNLLNWAFMSSLDLARKALIGFGWNNETPSAGDVFTYSGNFCAGSWTSGGTVCSNEPLTPITYTDLEDGNKCTTATVNIGGSDYKYAFDVKQSGETPSNLIKIRVLPGTTAPSCSGVCAAPCTEIINLGASGKKIAMKITNEPRTGLIQKYADKDSNYQYDTDVPRFGVKRWNSGASQQEDIIRDSPSLTPTERATFFRHLLSAVSKSPGTDSSTPNLADMQKQIINYMKGSSSSYSDNDPYSQTPYDWANDPAKKCRKTYALYITTGTNLGQDSNKLSPLPSACSSLTYTDAFPTNTCYAYNTDLYTTDGSPPKQNISTYVVHTTFYGGAGDDTTVAKLTHAANISDGDYLKVDDPARFEETLKQAILDMLHRAASGTAVSVLASGEGSGANLLHGVFYPRTPKIPLGMFSERLAWIGRLANFWYYIDPFFTTSTILEDTTADAKLNLSTDKTVKLRYDTTNEYAVGDLYPYGNPTLSSTVRLEYLKSLWDAGIQLWNRNLSTTPRTIYTTINGSSFLSNNFSTTNKTILKDYLQASTNDESEAIIRYIHGEDNPVVSSTIYSYRSRTSAVDLNGDGDTADTVNGISESAKVWKLGDILNSTPKIASWLPLNSYNTTYSDTTYQSFIDAAAYQNRGMVFAGGNDGMLHAFKLGKLELPNDSRADTCTFGTNDKACLSNPTGYLGGSSIPVGHEMWAFIPKNVLPYLRYMLDTDYCHVYSVDFTPYIFDASINIDPTATGQIAACSSSTYSDYWKCKKSKDSWRTILIGGMRTGGACRGTTTVCTDVSGDGQKDCVNTPVDVSGQSVGYSSYFALDVTDQNNPQLLWEFSDPELGFATTGPAVVRIKSRTASATTSTPDADTNGRWFVVFGSGPTGPVSSGDTQFLGRSDQNMKLFIFDIKAGPGANNANVTIKDTTIPYAFAGSMLNATHDSDTDYQDDAVYIPYVKKYNICTVDTWTNGGISRLLTKEDLDGNDVSSTGSTALNPNNWAWSKVIDNVGPVTSAVARLENPSAGLMWLYFGTGRYSFVQGATVDDADNRRALFGIKDPCFSTSGFNTSCTTQRTFCTTPCSNPSACTGPSTCGELTNVTDVANTPINPEDESFKGWYINLEGSGSYTYSPDAARNFKAERVITDPLATTSGVVFFTTYKPYSDECDIGGKSFTWAVKYSTGGSAGALLKGKALIPTSTGAIEQVDLSTAFSEAGGRRTTALEGVPPTAQGLSIISPPPPVKRILHIRER